jgi:hypothetical protein
MHFTFCFGHFLKWNFKLKESNFSSEHSKGHKNLTDSHFIHMCSMYSSYVYWVYWLEQALQFLNFIDCKKLVMNLIFLASRNSTLQLGQVSLRCYRHFMRQNSQTKFWQFWHWTGCLTIPWQTIQTSWSTSSCYPWSMITISLSIIRSEMSINLDFMCESIYSCICWLEGSKKLPSVWSASSREISRNPIAFANSGASSFCSSIGILWSLYPLINVFEDLWGIVDISELREIESFSLPS